MAVAIGSGVQNDIVVEIVVASQGQADFGDIGGGIILDTIVVSVLVDIVADTAHGFITKIGL